MGKKIKVIVFTMAYNAQATIRRAIDSILNQSHSNFEYYILDNASTDDTGAIIRDYAKRDKRIVPIRVNKNDPLNGGAFFYTICYATAAKYSCWCDADDAYTLDFLENMVNFAEENQLDIAACGYDKIDALSGKIIKHRALDKNLVLYDQLFSDEFIQYRGFMSYLWGKLYSISLLTGKKRPQLDSRRVLRIKPRKEQICNDSRIMTQYFQSAKKAGIYAKAMYKYYIYPNSLSNINIEQSLQSYRDLWQATKDYIEFYGPISKINEDFLYAIHLSLVDEAQDKVMAAALSADKKLELLEYIFSDPIWAETLAREADPQFINLAGRRAYVEKMRNKILALAEGNKAKVASLLNKVASPSLAQAT